MAWRSGSVNVRISRAHGPRNIRHSRAVPATSQAMRTSACSNVVRMRAAVGRIHALSLVKGSRATKHRWNVVSSSATVRLGPLMGVSLRSGGGLVATARERIPAAYPVSQLTGHWRVDSGGAQPSGAVTDGSLRDTATEVRQSFRRGPGCVRRSGDE